MRCVRESTTSWTPVARKTLHGQRVRLTAADNSRYSFAQWFLRRGLRLPYTLLDQTGRLFVHSRVARGRTSFSERIAMTSFSQKIDRRCDMTEHCQVPCFPNHKRIVQTLFFADARTLKKSSQYNKTKQSRTHLCRPISHSQPSIPGILFHVGSGRGFTIRTACPWQLEQRRGHRPRRYTRQQ